MPALPVTPRGPALKVAATPHGLTDTAPEYLTPAGRLSSFHAALETLAHVHTAEVEGMATELRRLRSLLHSPRDLSGMDSSRTVCSKNLNGVVKPNTPRADSIEPLVGAELPELENTLPPTPTEPDEVKDVKAHWDRTTVSLAHTIGLPMGSAPRKDFVTYECWQADGHVVGSGSLNSTADLADMMGGTHAKFTKSRASATTVSLTAKLSLPPLMFHPQGSLRVCWGVVCLLLVLYDCIMLPMLVFDLEQFAFQDLFEWFEAIFWSLDIIVNFRTAVYTKDSKIEYGQCIVACQYIKSWLVLDMAIVAAGWSNLLLAATSITLASASTLRVFKIFRFIRLLRAFKTLTYLRDYVVKYSNSSMYIKFINVVSRLWSLVLINHIFACVWYGVGNTSTDGWVANHEALLETQNKEADLTYWYLTSLHWSVSQFIGSIEIFPTPANALERCCAVIVMLLALFICSTLISSITTMMVEVEGSFREEKETREALREFLKNFAIDKDLCVMAKKQMDERFRSGSQHQSQTKLFEVMPPKLRVKVQAEMRLTVLKEQWVFSMLNVERKEFLYKLCQIAMHDMNVQASEFVFSSGDASHSMYVILLGRFMYIEQTLSRDFLASLDVHASSRSLESTTDNGAELSTHLSKSAAVSEACLWTDWLHTGEMSCVEGSGSYLVVIDAPAFTRLAAGHYDTKKMLVPYAHFFVNSINKHGCTDLGLETPELKAQKALAASRHGSKTRRLGRGTSSLGRRFTKFFSEAASIPST